VHISLDRRGRAYIDCLDVRVRAIHQSDGVVAVAMDTGPGRNAQRWGLHACMAIDASVEIQGQDIIIC